MLRYDVILVGDVVAAAVQRGLRAEYEAGYTHVFVSASSKSQAAGKCGRFGEIFYVCCLLDAEGAQ